MTTARGFAVVMDGKIDLRTVYPHTRGAIVNWLVTEGDYSITDATSDEYIFNRWERRRGTAEVVLVEVRVLESAT